MIVWSELNVLFFGLKTNWTCFFHITNMTLVNNFSFSLILVFFSNDQLGAYLKSIRQSFYPEKMCRKIVIHILPLVNKTKKLFYFIQSFRFFSFGSFNHPIHPSMISLLSHTKIEKKNRKMIARKGNRCTSILYVHIHRSNSNL